MGELHMDRGLVLYKSKYGATKKYADMLQAELRCDLGETRRIREFALEAYDWIVFAGGIYASGIAGLDALRKVYPQIKRQKIAVFCVGAAPFDEKAFAEVKAHNLKGNLDGIPVFYGRGAWDEGKMTWRDRTLCKMLQKAVAKKALEDQEPWMTGLLSAAGQKADWTDRAYLLPLLAYLGEG